MFERIASIRRATDDFFKKIRAEPETALESNDTYFVKLIIEHDLGVSLTPSWSVREEIKNGRLGLLEIKKHELRRSVAMLSLKGVQPSPIRDFTKYIVEQKEKLQSLSTRRWEKAKIRRNECGMNIEDYQDVFEPFDKLIVVEICGERREVPENNSLLRCFQFLSPETVSYGDFCWNGDCLNCRVSVEDGKGEKTVLACRAKIEEGMKIAGLSEEIKLVRNGK